MRIFSIIASLAPNGAVLAFLLLLSACAAPGVRELSQNLHIPRQYELTQTPFFPQDAYQCGPAALATALNAIDISVSPQQLVPEVYLPSRKGSLQIEMLAAARRHGALAVKIEPNVASLLEEIAAGNVVVVMQNLGLSWVPSWHYAVVVGYDLDKSLIWLRSGTYQRFEMTLSTFERTWARSKHWGFVALSPGSLPATGGVEPVISALLAFEKTATSAQALAAYASAAQRWPDDLVLLIGIGNHAYASGDLQTAATALHKAVAAHPDAAIAHNNLATVLLAQGDVHKARIAAQSAMRLSAQDDKLRAQIEKTLEEINAHAAAK